jgi:hypothetical protein
MVDVVNALQDPVIRHAERGELQRAWIGAGQRNAAHLTRESLDHLRQLLDE